jgi:DNA-binding CsgD family transcriptional regulator
MDDLSKRLVSFGARSFESSLDSLGPLRPDMETGAAHAVYARFRAGSDEISFLAWWRQQPLDLGDAKALMSTMKVLWKWTPDVDASINVDRYQPILDAFSCATYLVDQNMVLASANPIGRQMLDEAEHFRLVEGQLTFVDEATRRLVRGEMCRLSREQASSSTHAIPMTWKDEQRFAFVFRLVEFGPPAFLLVITDLDDRLAASRIVSIFGLSRAEARVLPGLLRAHKASDIARLQNLSEATVRTYTRRIMSKIEITRRAELYRLIALTMSPFRETHARSGVPKMRPPGGGPGITNGRGRE